MWDKTFGGNGNDQAISVIRTVDDGYLLFGNSDSAVGGDKTQDSRGNGDFWLVKIDSYGNKEWDKTFGGTGADAAASIVTTIDGGYLMLGSSMSDSGGEKTQNSRGAYDYWIVKIDSNGTKIWDKRFGWTGHEMAKALIPCTDDGYLLTGYSQSGIGGDKTQETGGLEDYWAVKIDANGNKIWDKTFGGTNSDLASTSIATPGGGFLLLGYSPSGIGGDKTQLSYGAYDYWAVKIDANGNKIWDKTFGGLGSNYAYSATTTSDGAFLLLGNSNSEVGGVKTQASQGGYDYWLVKIDANGNKIWDKAFGGSDSDTSFSVISTIDGGGLIAGYSGSGESGDKTQASQGGSDFWVLKIDANGNK
jgi:hypothetical protein